jgi:hypothetical protein
MLMERAWRRARHSWTIATFERMSSTTLRRSAAAAQYWPRRYFTPVAMVALRSMAVGVRSADGGSDETTRSVYRDNAQTEPAATQYGSGDVDHLTCRGRTMPLQYGSVAAPDPAQIDAVQSDC